MGKIDWDGPRMFVLGGRLGWALWWSGIALVVLALVKCVFPPAAPMFLVWGWLVITFGAAYVAFIVVVALNSN